MRLSRKWLTAIDVVGLIFTYFLLNFIEYRLYNRILPDWWRGLFVFLIWICLPIILGEVKWKSKGKKKAAIAVWVVIIAAFACTCAYKLPGYTYDGAARIIVSEYPELEGVEYDEGRSYAFYSGKYFYLFETEPITGYVFDPDNGSYEYVGLESSHMSLM